MSHAPSAWAEGTEARSDASGWRSPAKLWLGETSLSIFDEVSCSHVQAWLKGVRDSSDEWWHLEDDGLVSSVLIVAAARDQQTCQTWSES